MAQVLRHSLTIARSQRSVKLPVAVDLSPSIRSHTSSPGLLLVSDTVGSVTEAPLLQLGRSLARLPSCVRP